MLPEMYNGFTSAIFEEGKGILAQYIHFENYEGNEQDVQMQTAPESDMTKLVPDLLNFRMRILEIINKVIENQEHNYAFKKAEKTGFDKL